MLLEYVCILHHELLHQQLTLKRPMQNFDWRLFPTFAVRNTGSTKCVRLSSKHIISAKVKGSEYSSLFFTQREKETRRYIAAAALPRRERMGEEIRHHAVAFQLEMQKNTSKHFGLFKQTNSSNTSERIRVE